MARYPLLIVLCCMVAAGLIAAVAAYVIPALIVLALAAWAYRKYVR